MWLWPRLHPEPPASSHCFSFKWIYFAHVCCIFNTGYILWPTETDIFHFLTWYCYCVDVRRKACHRLTLRQWDFHRSTHPFIFFNGAASHKSPLCPAKVVKQQSAERTPQTLPGRAILLRAVGFRQPHGLRIILSQAARLDRRQLTFIPLRKRSEFVLTTCCAAYTCPKETHWKWNRLYFSQTKQGSCERRLVKIKNCVEDLYNIWNYEELFLLVKDVQRQLPLFDVYVVWQEKLLRQ